MRDDQKRVGTGWFGVVWWLLTTTVMAQVPFPPTAEHRQEQHHGHRHGYHHGRVPVWSFPFPTWQSPYSLWRPLPYTLPTVYQTLGMDGTLYRSYDPNFLGPGALQYGPTMNLAPNFARPLAPPPIAIPALIPPADPGLEAPPPGTEIQRRASVLKRSQPAARERADRVIARGDEAFAQQKLASALARYREAIAKAPDYPKPHFRLAHTQVAANQFNLALSEFLIALELSGTAERTNFSLAELYRGNKLAQQLHLDRLQDAINREPNDGGLLFLLALSLHYDEQPFAARELFVKAQTMEGPHRDYVRHFLPVVAIAEP